MIVDTSVLICLLREEPETPRLLAAMLSDVGPLRMSSANYLETGIVVDANGDDALSEKVDRLIDHFNIEIVPVSFEHAKTARRAYREFGKGRHPAGLNFGDCFAYALARDDGAPLLFKGDDFAQTDVRVASVP